MNLIEAKINNGYIDAGVFGFDVPSDYKQLLSDRSKVIIGIRPENIMAENQNSDIEAEFNIDFVENTGAIKVLHLSNEGGEVKAVINSNDSLSFKESFYFNSKNFIFFDYFTKEIIQNFN